MKLCLTRCIVLLSLMICDASVTAQKTPTPPPDVIISGGADGIPIVKAGGDTPESRKQAEDNKRAEALWVEGKEFAKQKNWRETIRVLEECLKLDADCSIHYSQPAHVLLAEAYENTNQLDKAITVFRQFIRTKDSRVARMEKEKSGDSDITQSYIRFAQLLYKRGLYDQARDAYDVATRFFQPRREMEFLAIRLDGRNSASVYMPKRLEAGINIMLVMAWDRVDTPESVPYIHAAAKALPNSGVTQLLLASVLYWHENKPEESKAALERAAQLGPLAVRKRAERALKGNWEGMW